MQKPSLTGTSRVLAATALGFSTPFAMAYASLYDGPRQVAGVVALILACVGIGISIGLTLREELLDRDEEE